MIAIKEVANKPYTFSISKGDEKLQLNFEFSSNVLIFICEDVNTKNKYREEFDLSSLKAKYHRLDRDTPEKNLKRLKIEFLSKTKLDFELSDAYVDVIFKTDKANFDFKLPLLKKPKDASQPKTQSSNNMQSSSSTQSVLSFLGSPPTSNDFEKRIEEFVKKEQKKLSDRVQELEKNFYQKKIEDELRECIDEKFEELLNQIKSMDPDKKNTSSQAAKKEKESQIFENQENIIREIKTLKDKINDNNSRIDDFYNGTEENLKIERIKKEIRDDSLKTLALEKEKFVKQIKEELKLEQDKIFQQIKEKLNLEREKIIQQLKDDLKSTKEILEKNKVPAKKKQKKSKASFPKLKSVSSMCLMNKDRIAFVSEKNRVDVYNLSTWKCEVPMKDIHQGSILYLTALDDDSLVTCSEDKTIKIFQINEADFTLKETLSGHQKPVNVVKKLSKNRLVSASLDHSIKIWSLDKYICEKTLSEENSNCFYASSLLELQSSPYLVSAGSWGDSTLVFWKASDFSFHKSIDDVSAYSSNSLIELSSKELLVGGANKFHIVNVSKLEVEKTVKIKYSICSAYELNDKGVVLFGTNCGSLVKFNISKTAEDSEKKINNDKITSIVFANEHEKFITGSTDESSSVQEFAKGEIFGTS